MILSIDPGLDDLGFAVFDYDRFQDDPSHVGAVNSLIYSWTFSTSPADPLPRRLSLIGTEIGGKTATLAAEHSPFLAVVVEMPAYSGTYRNSRASRENLNKLYMAVGAILSVSNLVAPTLAYPAVGSPKIERFNILDMLMRECGKAMPRGPRGGQRQDEIDAIYSGWSALTTGSVKHHLSLEL